MSAALLRWYDEHARSLPWRIPPAQGKAGRRADPYAVWLSEVMLQQTTVAAVRPYFAAFLDRWPTVADLAAAGDDAVMAAWAGLGYYARARAMLRCARAVAADGGRFPDTEEGLRALPGIGPYTAAAVAAIAFGKPAVVVDGNVERVVARLFAVTLPLPRARAELRALAARLTPDDRPGDHAQAMMDLGATICTPRRPDCPACPLTGFCAGRAAGVAADLPVKPARPPKPERRGHVFVGRRGDGAWLLERRPETGLLGGMLGWPGSDWAAEAPAATPPLAAGWRALNAPVVHVFTHFRLTLTVWVADLPAGAGGDGGAGHGLPAGAMVLPAGVFDPAALPTVMRKALDLALPHLAQPG